MIKINILSLFLGIILFMFSNLEAHAEHTLCGRDALVNLTCATALTYAAPFLTTTAVNQKDDKEEQDEFIEKNKEDLKEEIPQGDGPHIEVFITFFDPSISRNIYKSEIRKEIVIILNNHDDGRIIHSKVSGLLGKY